MRPVRRLKRLQIRTPKLDESVAFYTTGFGLELAGIDERTARLKGARGDAIVLEITRTADVEPVGLTFGMSSEADLEQSRLELVRAGFPAEPMGGSGAFSIADPDGRRIGFELDGEAPNEAATADGRPLFISHVVLNSADAPRLMAFYVDALRFKIADRYEKDALVFLRCAQPQHHCIGISPGAPASLNHFSADVGSIDAVMRGIGRMHKLGHKPIWGPGRHGPGGNVFCYFEDPAGLVCEFTCDVIQIEDEATWVAKEWPRVPDIGNVWGTGGPSQRAIDLMGGKRSSAAP